MKKMKSFLMGTGLFYITVYIPLGLMTYFPIWYKLNCMLHPGCDFIGKSYAAKLIDELNGFFFHRNKLISGWTAKEKFHLLEVRGVIDFLSVLIIAAIIVFVLFFDKQKIATIAFVNMITILSLFVLLFFFKFFWAKIFHPLLFDNNLWRTNPFDRSYYLMPRIFFKNSMIFLIAFSATINGTIWLIFRKKAPDKISNTN
jgi:hypothetical protein